MLNYFPAKEVHLWGCSSAGRAQGWQSWGQGFESPQLHHPPTAAPTGSERHRAAPEERARAELGVELRHPLERNHLGHHGADRARGYEARRLAELPARRVER